MLCWTGPMQSRSQLQIGKQPMGKKARKYRLIPRLANYFFLHHLSNGSRMSCMLFLLVYTHILGLLPSVDAVKGCVIFGDSPSEMRALCDSFSDILTSIPLDLPPELRKITIKNQTIKQIDESSLSNLPELVSLTIVSSQLTSIHHNAFKNLAKLQFIDLTDNYLKFNSLSLPPRLFSSLPKLQTLILSKNPLGTISHGFLALETSALTSLVMADIKESRLGLAENVFRELPASVTKLDFRKAGLTTLPEFHLPELKELYLDSNPWNCDCNLDWLRKLFTPIKLYQLQYKTVFQDQNLTLEPTCSEPTHLARLKIAQAQRREEAFLCKPQLLNPKNGNVSHEVRAQANVTLPCEVSRESNCDIRWLKNDRPVNDQIEPRISVSTHRNTEQKTLMSKLFIMSVSAQDYGTWTCQCDNRLGSASASFQLLAPQQVPFPSLDDTLLYVIIGISVLLVSCLVLVLALCLTGKLGPQFGEFMQHKKSPQHTVNEEENAELIADRSGSKEHLLEAVLNSPKVYSPLPTAGAGESIPELGGKLIQEAATIGGNRLLVSCDGPEPTVLLATGLPYAQLNPFNLTPVPSSLPMPTEKEPKPVEKNQQHCPLHGGGQVAKTCPVHDVKSATLPPKKACSVSTLAPGNKSNASQVPVKTNNAAKGSFNTLPSKLSNKEMCPLHGTKAGNRVNFPSTTLQTSTTSMRRSLMNLSRLKAAAALLDASTSSSSSSFSDDEDNKTLKAILKKNQIARAGVDRSQLEEDFEDTFDRLSRHSQMSLRASSVTSSSSRQGSVTNSTVKTHFYPVRSNCSVHGTALRSTPSKSPKVVQINPVGVDLSSSASGDDDNLSLDEARCSSSSNSSSSSDLVPIKPVLKIPLDENSEEFEAMDGYFLPPQPNDSVPAGAKHKIPASSSSSSNEDSSDGFLSHMSSKRDNAVKINAIPTTHGTA
ncbi:hypothetical protein Ciccas_000474 [Cichlidogyrus casuarinus]|uniref:Ig-like domain-containing protein n=1 Tax=Cichlidogyrus casuarinus TaxID=1844966 RepID=A0ABD2QN73_9PLAT